MKFSLHVLKACTLSVALLGSAAIVAAVSVPDVAFAKSGNGNGNGNGGGKGNGGDNGGGKGNAGGKSGGGAAEKSNGKAKEKSGAATTKAAVKPKKKTLADELGVSASELGALNAAHANANALKNASPNSRVGRIAAYRDAVLAGEELQAELEAKQAELDGMTAPERTSTEVQTDLAAASTLTGEKAGVVAALEQALQDAGGVDETIETDLATARSELAAAQDAEAALQSEYDDALAYETLSGQVDDLTQQVEDQPELERSLLEAASNKPVTDEVEAAVKLLLGL